MDTMKNETWIDCKCDFKNGLYEVNKNKNCNKHWAGSRIKWKQWNVSNQMC